MSLTQQTYNLTQVSFTPFMVVILLIQKLYINIKKKLNIIFYIQQKSEIFYTNNTKRNNKEN